MNALTIGLTPKLHPGPQSVAVLPRDTGHAAPYTINDRVEALQQSINHFDLQKARWKAGLTIAGTILANGIIGELCHTFLTPDAALFASIGMSVGLTSVGILGVSHAMQGLRDTSMYGGIAVLSSFAGPWGCQFLAQPGYNPLLVTAGAAALGALVGYAFGHGAQSSHYNAAARIARAQGVVEKFEAYQQQHERLMSRVPAQAPSAA